MGEVLSIISEMYRRLRYAETVFIIGVAYKVMSLWR